MPKPDIHPHIPEDVLTVGGWVDEGNLPCPVAVIAPDVAPRGEHLPVDIFQIEGPEVQPQTPRDRRPVGDGQVEQALAPYAEEPIASEPHRCIDVGRAEREQSAATHERQKPDVLTDVSELQVDLQRVIEVALQQGRQRDVLGVLKLGPDIGHDPDLQGRIRALEGGMNAFQSVERAQGELSIPASVDIPLSK